MEGKCSPTRTGPEFTSFATAEKSMPVSSSALRTRLASRDPNLLRAVLEASDVSWRDDDDADALADDLRQAAD